MTISSKNKKRLYVIVAVLLSLNGMAQQPTVINIGDNGWKLWLDREADWRNDELYLPPLDVSAITVSPPTCGWEQLFSDSRPSNQVKQFIKDRSISYEVDVPGTVEEYCWDALSRFGGLGTSGDYKGVSWWGTDFNVPTSAKGEKIKLFFTEGIRQRAEVFVNQKHYECRST